MKYNRLLFAMAILVFASLACSLFNGGRSGVDETLPSVEESAPEENAPAEAPEYEEPPANTGNYESEFPLPTDVENLIDLGDGAVNYQTSMSLTDVIAFYRDSFAGAGYTERDITTSITETTFSIVWDGHPSGKAIVVQGVDLGNGTVNVNVRFEDV